MERQRILVPSFVGSSPTASAKGVWQNGYCNSLENCRWVKPSVGSNPTAPAIFVP